MYAIIDIETTGGSTQHEKITEIAVFIHDGFQIVEQFSSLVNPGRPIPVFVSRLTGITDSMVARAPRFYEIAKKIVELTEGKIFIAHNVNFDYNFIREEFKSLGYDYSRKKLCTVQLSRKLIPGKKSYSLGKICAELGIIIPPDQRHRAAGDAFATVKLFEFLLTQNTSNEMFNELEKQDVYKKLSTDLHRALLDKVPEDTGVYYIRDMHGNIIYVGKSINIRDRILQHLNNHESKKSIDIANTLHEVDYILTGSDMIASLLEADEIKKIRPLHNRAQRKTMFNYCVLPFYDFNGYLNFRIEKLGKDEEPMLTFGTSTEAKEFMFKLVDQNKLCQQLSGIGQGESACFQYQIKKCKGACIGEEAAEDYNIRAQSVLSRYQYGIENFLIIDKGRTHTERSVVRVENGKYIGFGYFDPEMINGNIEELKTTIKKYRETKDIAQIIRTVLLHKRYEKLIQY